MDKANIERELERVRFELLSLLNLKKQMESFDEKKAELERRYDSLESQLRR
ncbi:hypothetical protein [Metabacillus sp. FJAT-53654]|uniref:Uncharacterized protein n=1 Tax=Metabacillus rhizosphaerae TaxID=3117747 RepID=A0ABZ2MNP5_9BACI